MQRRRRCSFRSVSRAAPSVLAASAAVAFLAPVASSGSAGAAQDLQRLTVYSVVTTAQFIDTKDDRRRGYGNNPFGNFNDLTPTTKQKNTRTLPGDFVLLKFNVSTNPTLKKRVGSAILTCTFSFNNHAFCSATYELDGGILTGAGSIDFSSSSFTIAITGGSGKYAGLRGDMQSTPAPRRAQRLVFRLS